MDGSTSKLRQKFLELYSVVKINIFEEKVFENVRITICSFQFDIKNCNYFKSTTLVSFFPQKKRFLITLPDSSKPIIDVSIFQKVESDIVVKPFSENQKSKIFETNILLNLVDNKKKIHAILTESCLKVCSSCKISIFVNVKLTLKEQQIIVERFNTVLADLRLRFSSLMLPYFYESRKRLSVQQAVNLTTKIITDLKGV